MPGADFLNRIDQPLAPEIGHAGEIRGSRNPRDRTGYLLRNLRSWSVTCELCCRQLQIAVQPCGGAELIALVLGKEYPALLSLATVSGRQ